MSVAEFQKYSAGLNIVGSHKCSTCNTTSSGVCFLLEKVKCHDITDYELNPIEAIDFLQGIVCDELLVEFETHLSLKNGEGIYASQQSDGLMIVEEYSLPSYNRDNCIALRYALVSNNNVVWYDYH